MQQGHVITFFVSFLVCFFAFAMKVTAEANREISAGRAYKPNGWKIFYQAVSSFGIGFLAVAFLVEWKTGNGMKIVVLFGVSFLATVFVDALLLIKPQDILREFSAWLAAKTGGTSTGNFSPPNDPQNEYLNQDPGGVGESPAAPTESPEGAGEGESTAPPYNPPAPE